MIYLSSIVLSITYPLLNKIQESKLAKGLTNLINDATTVAIALCIVFAGLYLAITSIKLQGAEEQEVAAGKKRMKTIVIACVIGISASTIIKIVTSYFK